MTARDLSKMDAGTVVFDEIIRTWGMSIEAVFVEAKAPKKPDLSGTSVYPLQTVAKLW